MNPHISRVALPLILCAAACTPVPSPPEHTPSPQAIGQAAQGDDGPDTGPGDPLPPAETAGVPLPPRNVLPIVQDGTTDQPITINIPYLQSDPGQGNGDDRWVICDSQGTQSQPNSLIEQTIGDMLSRNTITFDDRDTFPNLDVQQLTWGPHTGPCDLNRQRAVFLIEAPIQNPADQTEIEALLAHYGLPASWIDLWRSYAPSAKQGYVLTGDPNNIAIISPTREGVLYGVIDLLKDQAPPTQTFTWEARSVLRYPDIAHRLVHAVENDSKAPSKLQNLFTINALLDQTNGLNALKNAAQTTNIQPFEMVQQTLDAFVWNKGTLWYQSGYGLAKLRQYCTYADPSLCDRYTENYLDLVQYMGQRGVSTVPGHIHLSHPLQHQEGLGVFDIGIHFINDPGGENHSKALPASHKMFASNPSHARYETIEVEYDDGGTTTTATYLNAPIDLSPQAIEGSDNLTLLANNYSEHPLKHAVSGHDPSNYDVRGLRPEALYALVTKPASNSLAYSVALRTSHEETPQWGPNDAVDGMEAGLIKHATGVQIALFRAPPISHWDVGQQPDLFFSHTNSTNLDIELELYELDGLFLNVREYKVGSLPSVNPANNTAQIPPLTNRVTQTTTVASDAPYNIPNYPQADITGPPGGGSTVTYAAMLMWGSPSTDPKPLNSYDEAWWKTHGGDGGVNVGFGEHIHRLNELMKAEQARGTGYLAPYVGALNPSEVKANNSGGGFPLGTKVPQQERFDAQICRFDRVINGHQGANPPIGRSGFDAYKSTDAFQTSCTSMDAFDYCNCLTPYTPSTGRRRLLLIVDNLLHAHNAHPEYQIRYGGDLHDWLHTDNMPLDMLAAVWWYNDHPELMWLAEQQLMQALWLWSGYVGDDIIAGLGADEQLWARSTSSQQSARNTARTVVGHPQENVFGFGSTSWNHQNTGASAWLPIIDYYDMAGACAWDTHWTVADILTEDPNSGCYTTLDQWSQSEPHKAPYAITQPGAHSSNANGTAWGTPKAHILSDSSDGIPCTSDHHTVRWRLDPIDADTVRVRFKATHQSGAAQTPTNLTVTLSDTSGNTISAPVIGLPYAPKTNSGFTKTNNAFAADLDTTSLSKTQPLTIAISVPTPTHGIYDPATDTIIQENIARGTIIDSVVVMAKRPTTTPGYGPGSTLDWFPRADKALADLCRSDALSDTEMGPSIP